MRKLFLFITAFMLTTALWASNTLTYTATKDLSNEYYLTVGKTTFGPTITSHTFSNGTGTITCSGDITTIGDDAFRDCSGLTSITIPNSVTTIGERAFEYCSSLTSIEIPNSVTTIGERAFYNCSSLTSIEIPNSVTTIGDYAFFYCTGLTSVTIGNSVTTIGNYAFDGCSSLTSVTIPNSVTTIGQYAFYECSNLTSVTIPNSVTTIGSNAFYYVNNLVYSGTATGSPWGAKCMNGYVEGYLVYSGATKTKLCGCSSAATGAITIPNSVTTIGSSAFSPCSGLTSITIPNSVTTIGEYAFAGCSGLISITIPNSVTTIGDKAFYDCSGLTSIQVAEGNTKYDSRNNCNALIETATNKLITGCQNTIIPNSVTTIGVNAFRDCSGLTSVTIPNSVTTIGGSAFSDCTGLTSVTIGNSVTTIGNSAFWNCSGLTSVTIPNSVTTIGDYAFDYCSGLISITIPNSVTTIGDYAFYDCSRLTSIQVAEGNTKYDSRNNCNALIETATNKLITGCQNTIIPNSVTTIGVNAFRDCSGLTSISIPNSVTTIEISAFNNCTGLTSVTIPNSVTTIGNSAFEGCSGLTSITCYATTPPTCGSSCFYNVSKSIPVYVPAHSVDAYKQANKWKEFTNIQAIKQGQCGEDLYWEYNDGILVISGIGAMYDYTQGTAPWMPLFKDSISSLVINNGCTSIGNFAFYGLSNKNLKTIDIPNSVEQIGQYAFANCEYVKNLYLGLSLERISANAFANDERLLYITCYAIEPPLLDESAFVNYDAYLSVPCESQADYKVAIGWKKFNKENVSCIGAEETPVTTDEVTVAPEANQATFTWPANNSADGYSLEITKDGVVFCTLKFNAQGQLTGIAFAPSRDGAREMAAATMTASGWQFTVTGLNQASKYGYTLDALNAGQQSIKHYEGEFYTDGYTGLNRFTDSPVNRFTKMIRNNQLQIMRNGKLFNALGGEVR